MTVAPSEAPLIDALSAATALTPFLPPVELPTDMDGSRRRVLYIDGSRVSHEPTHALLALIRKYRNKKGHGPLHIYSVTPYPSSKQEMPEVDANGKPSGVKIPGPHGYRAPGTTPAKVSGRVPGASPDRAGIERNTGRGMLCARTERHGAARLDFPGRTGRRQRTESAHSRRGARPSDGSTLKRPSPTAVAPPFK